MRKRGRAFIISIGIMMAAAALSGLWKEGRGSGCDNGGVGGDDGRDEDDRP